jgi:hypothetical protein
MGYKILGFAVWRGAKWYLRRRFQGTTWKFAVVALAGLLVVGGVAAQRQRSSE